jgi:hypothetical protein
MNRKQLLWWKPKIFRPENTVMFTDCGDRDTKKKEEDPNHGGPFRINLIKVVVETTRRRNAS